VKKKILFLSDHPLCASGVGTQANYLINGLLRTGKYQFRCFGGAIKHSERNVIRVAPEVYGDDWLIVPVVGHGDPNLDGEFDARRAQDYLRAALHQERPDALVIFNDPRFFVWVWQIEDQVRRVCPFLYWHVWDNDPAPDFNRTFYDSTDHIAALSLKTFGLLEGTGYPRDRFRYIPHGLPPDLFKPLPQEEVERYRAQLGALGEKKFIALWINRNARRKQTGDVIESFAKFARQVGEEKVGLLMHTAAKDPEGQDIHALIRHYGAEKFVFLSEQQVNPEDINMMYNLADCTINISSNEGFGLGTLEALFAGTPMVVHMTGGLQFQVGDWWEELAGAGDDPFALDPSKFVDQEALHARAKRLWNREQGNWWGAPVFPSVRSCTGCQPIPYIYDDRVKNEDVAAALRKLYDMGRKNRKAVGLRGREWALKRFTIDRVVAAWDRMLEEQIERRRVEGPPGPRVVGA
jgi:glycosyltransferase involved in cell wall biosynthesis